MLQSYIVTIDIYFIYDISISQIRTEQVRYDLGIRYPLSTSDERMESML
jgi:hypothetical protein